MRVHMCVHAPGGQRTTWSVIPWHLSSSLETGPLSKKSLLAASEPCWSTHLLLPCTGSLSVDHCTQLCVYVGDQTQIFTLVWQTMTTRAITSVPAVEDFKNH